MCEPDWAKLRESEKASADAPAVLEGAPLGQSESARLQSAELLDALTPEEEAEIATTAKDVRLYASQVYDHHLTSEPPLRSEERALLREFDTLPVATQKGILLGKPDREGGRFLRRVKRLMRRMLAEMEAQWAATHAEQCPSEYKLEVIGRKSWVGQRPRPKQAQLFFQKLFSTDGCPKFFEEEPINRPESTARGQCRHLDREGWLADIHVPERLNRVLKYSALPSVSRHHWGTDVDLGSDEPEDWEPTAPLGPTREWLESHRDVLPLRTTYSGEREGGYLPEPWHLSMGTLGEGLHDRYNALISNEEIIDSVMLALDEWAASHPKVVNTATREAVYAALLNIDVRSYVDQVNPDIKPENAR